MTQRIKHTQSAGPGQVFAPDVFDSQVGKTVPMNIEGRPVEGGCKIVGADVSGDGSSVQLTLEVPDGALQQDSFDSGDFGFEGN